MKQPNLAKLQTQVDDFNNRFPVGTLVRVRLDNGQTKDTKTRSPAQVLSGHSAVVWLEGISGCYMLERVSPLATMNETPGEGTGPTGETPASLPALPGQSPEFVARAVEVARLWQDFKGASHEPMVVALRKPWNERLVSDLVLALNLMVADARLDEEGK